MSILIPLITAKTILHKVKTAYACKTIDTYTITDSENNLYGEIDPGTVTELLKDGFCQADIFIDSNSAIPAIVSLQNIRSIKNTYNRFAVSAKPIAELKVVPLCMISFDEKQMMEAFYNLIGGFDREQSPCTIKLWNLTKRNRLIVSATMISLCDNVNGEYLRYQVVPVLSTYGKPIKFMVIFNQNIERGTIFEDIYEAINFAKKAADENNGYKKKTKSVAGFEFDDDDDDD